MRQKRESRIRAEERQRIGSFIHELLTGHCPAEPDYEAALQMLGDRLVADSELRAALDDLWGCIGVAEFAHLQEATRTIAQQNHLLLHHSSTEQQGER